ncbi:hypothetical protein BH09MYX1_BH09MYX1_07950 [soil metagenome]
MAFKGPILRPGDELRSTRGHRWRLRVLVRSDRFGTVFEVTDVRGDRSFIKFLRPLPRAVRAPRQSWLRRVLEIASVAAFAISTLLFAYVMLRR